MCIPDSSVGKESTCNVGDLGSIPGLGRSSCCLQCGRPGFDLWVGKIPWRRERLPIPVFWPREFHGLYSPWKESDTTERLSHTHTHTNYDFPGGGKKKSSLTVPWLRLCASPVGGIGSIPNRETKISCIPPSQTKKGKKTLNYMRC